MPRLRVVLVQQRNRCEFQTFVISLFDVCHLVLVHDHGYGLVLVLDLDLHLLLHFVASLS